MEKKAEHWQNRCGRTDPPDATPDRNGSKNGLDSKVRALKSRAG